MKLDIVTPEGSLFSGEIESIVVPGVNGAFEILNQHAPIVSILIKGDIRIKGSNIIIDDAVKERFTVNSDEVKLVINSGTLEMKNNKIIILAE